MNPADRIAENLSEVRQRVAAATKRSGRTSDAVTLIAVTKYVDVATTRLVAEAGCPDLGESRPQQLWEKADSFRVPGVRWHLVGHLQRNKIRKTLPHVSLIHSVDSEALLLAIDRIAGEIGEVSSVLLEVNISGDESKHGLATTEVAPLLEIAGSLAHVHVRGLMTMAALTGGEEVSRRNFAELRQLRDRLALVSPPGIELKELSIGMSRDYEIAIEEGATLVRVGSALFEGVA